MNLRNSQRYITACQHHLTRDTTADTKTVDRRAAAAAAAEAFTAHKELAGTDAAIS
jgi:hypothetical protein